MNRKALTWTLLVLGCVGSGLLALYAGLDSRPWLIAFLDRSEALAGFLTVMAIGVTLDLLPSKRFAAVLMIVCTLLIDTILLGMGFRYLRMWEVVALVVAAVLAGIAALVSADGQREKLATRILLALSLPVIIFLAVLVIVLVDMPWF